jgi:hypothetical protein
MIILRDKEFSSKRVQLLKAVKKIGNSVMTKVDNAGLSAGNSVKQIFTGKTSPSSRFRFQPKSNVQLNRETIAVKNKIKALPTKVMETSGKVANTRVGGLIDKGIESSIRRPDVALVATATQLTTPAGAAIGGPVGAAMCLPGYSAAIPIVAKHPMLPKGAIKYLDKKAGQYAKSGLSSRLKKSTATIGDYIGQVTSGKLLVPGINI